MVLINNEDEESDYCDDSDEQNKNIFFEKQIFYQQGLSKMIQIKTQLFSSFHKCINFPLYLYSYYLNWKRGIVNDFIIVE